MLVQVRERDVICERHSSGVDVVDQLQVQVVFESVDPQVVLDVECAARAGPNGGNRVDVFVSSVGVPEVDPSRLIGTDVDLT